MTIESVPNSDLKYYLISYDKNGIERDDDPDAANGMLSREFETVLADEPVTDVFLISHGWKGDIPAAKEQYDRWISAMLTCEKDIADIHEILPEFTPLIAGLHWPSLPWGDEDQVSELSFATSGANGKTIDELADDAADKICDSDRARIALRTIFAAAMEDIAPETLPKNVEEAYDTLISEMQIEAGGPSAPPGDDREPLTSQSMYQSSRSDAGVDFGSSFGEGILSPLRQLSFWRMKKRALEFGESGAADLLRRLQEIAEHRPVRFHLMGHSFGCIAMSACIAGRSGDQPLVKPVSTAYLVQGAFSIWSYCSDIPVARGKSGYFHSTIRGKKISGPLLTTQSEHDTAVGKLYPIAAGVKRQVVYDANELPRYAAVGTFGLRGPGIPLSDVDMKSVESSYDFKGGTTYNIQSSKFISEGRGLSGAHSDISKPAVAHVFWQGVLATMQ
jgi:hypothetical protein